MFGLGRNRKKTVPDEGEPQEAVSPSPKREVSDASGHSLLTGRSLRQEIKNCGPAFLEPQKFSEPEAFRALVTVLAAYSLGSRTAAHLVQQRQNDDPTWEAPTRKEAMQVVASLNRLRQYLPYLLGQRLQAAAAAASPPAGAKGSVPPPPPPAPVSPPNVLNRPENTIISQPARVPPPVVQTRPRSAEVLVRPVIALNRRSS